MNYTSLLTIAIPVFERNEFFLDALNSALNQTVKCKIIVVDNCSSHNYFEQICTKKAISYFRNERNLGMFPNWNRCIKYADTDFVMLLGDDDILLPTYVESFLNAKEKYENIDIFFCDFNLFYNETKNIDNHKHVLPFGYMENGSKVIEYGIYYRLGFPIITSAIKKSKFTGFYEEFHASNDWAWIYENAESLVFYGERKKLLRYRYHSNNDSGNSVTSLNCRLSMWYIYQVILEKYLNSELSNYLKRDIRYTAMYFICNIERIHIENIFKKQDRYSTFLFNTYHNNIIYKILLSMPLRTRKYFFKLLSKTRIIQ